MSYESTNTLPKGSKLSLVRETISLLGYKTIATNTEIAGQVGSYFWFKEEDFKSWTGIELQVYQKGNAITVDSRSRVSRSYWDLLHQNKTISLLKGIFGGSFETDAGKNRYWHPEGIPPTAMCSGAYLARWRFKNSLQRTKIYLSARNLSGEVAREKSSGFQFFDEFNPRLLSNNMLLPFAIGVWEDYFRSTFAAVLMALPERKSVFKKVRISDLQLERIASKALSVEDAISECLSFQRPSVIAENFKLLDSKLDLAAVLRKPYRRRKLSLFEGIESMVLVRNSLVHTGELDLNLFDSKLNSQLSDIVVAVDRVYDALGKHYSFKPIRDY